MDSVTNYAEIVSAACATLALVIGTITVGIARYDIINNRQIAAANELQSTADNVTKLGMDLMTEMDQRFRVVVNLRQSDANDILKLSEVLSLEIAIDRFASEFSRLRPLLERAASRVNRLDVVQVVKICEHVENVARTYSNLSKKDVETTGGNAISFQGEVKKFQGLCSKVATLIMTDFKLDELQQFRSTDSVH